MVTKSLRRIIAVVVGMIIFGVGQQAKAQYYEIANQLPGGYISCVVWFHELQRFY